jgi:hypothetical protein
MTKKPTNKKNARPRVRYNFTLKMPRGKFTMQKLMAANPSVAYITLKKRVDKMLESGVLEQKGLAENAAPKRGARQKVYGKVQIAKTLSKINPVSGLKSLVLAE